jgi:apolipoprotein N-acyltransferase
MLRCANTGVSAAIDTIGSTAHPKTGKPQILSGTNGSHFTRGSLLTELNIPVQPGFSLYAIIGDGGIILLSIIGLATAIMESRASGRLPGRK